MVIRYDKIVQRVTDSAYTTWNCFLLSQSYNQGIPEEIDVVPCSNSFRIMYAQVACELVSALIMSSASL